MPDFTISGMMKGPLMSLTIGNLMVDLPGYISSLSFDFADEYPWDIEVERPMYVKVDISYTVINKQMPNAAKKDWYTYSVTAEEAFKQRFDGNTNESLVINDFGVTPTSLNMTTGEHGDNIKS
jgi:hypothetical protein